MSEIKDLGRQIEQLKIDHAEQFKSINAKIESIESRTIFNITDAIPSFIPWFVSMAIYVILGVVSPILFPDWFTSIVAFVTSWATVLLLVACGIICSMALRQKSASLSNWTAAAFGGLLVNYLGYVIIDYGSHHANEAAAGFNISTNIFILVFTIVVLALTLGISKGLSRWKTKK